jgi:hypothetical protein
MDGFRFGLLGRGDDLVAAQIALFGGTRADMHGFIRLAHMQRFRVRVGINRDCAHPEPLGGADAAARDFAAVGYEDGFQHSYQNSLCSPSPRGGGGRGWGERGR